VRKSISARSARLYRRSDWGVVAKDLICEVLSVRIILVFNVYNVSVVRCSKDINRRIHLATGVFSDLQSIWRDKGITVSTMAKPQNKNGYKTWSSAWGNCDRNYLWMPDDRLLKTLMLGLVEGERQLGRPARRWIDDILTWCGGAAKTLKVQCRWLKCGGVEKIRG